MRLEPRALVGDPAHAREAEHLIAAAVGEDRPVPGHEPVQPAAPRDQIVTGPQVQVIGVAQNDLGAERLEAVVERGLHRAARADRHERRRLDAAVRECEGTASRAPVAVGDVEAEGHGGIVRCGGYVGTWLG